MSLPVLQGPASRSDEDLLRHFHRTELHWTRHLAEETALETGTAFANPKLFAVPDANRILDAAVPAGGSAAACLEEAKSHYAGQGVPCAGWVLNPAAPPATVRPLGDVLSEAGWVAAATDVWCLLRRPEAAPTAGVEEFTVIPARASFRHARILAEAAAEEDGQVQIAEADLLHLDDPHYDALLALHNGVAVGRVGVLAVGELGRIDELFVAPPFRGRGIGRMLLARAVEICARSLFRHVLLASGGEGLWVEFGFRRVGRFVEYRRRSGAN